MGLLRPSDVKVRKKIPFKNGRPVPFNMKVKKLLINRSSLNTVKKRNVDNFIKDFKTNHKNSNLKFIPVYVGFETRKGFVFKTNSNQDIPNNISIPYKAQLGSSYLIVMDGPKQLFTLSIEGKKLSQVLQETKTKDKLKQLILDILNNEVINDFESFDGYFEEYLHNNPELQFINGVRNRFIENRKYRTYYRKSIKYYYQNEYIRVFKL